IRCRPWTDCFRFPSDVAEPELVTARSDALAEVGIGMLWTEAPAVVYSSRNTAGEPFDSGATPLPTRRTTRSPSAIWADRPRVRTKVQMMAANAPAARDDLELLMYSPSGRSGRDGTRSRYGRSRKRPVRQREKEQWIR